LTIQYYPSVGFGSYWFVDSPRSSLLFHIFIQYCYVSLYGF
jgi:hypothetical protein